MTRKGNKSQTVVERLLEQQRQYQDWLERLHEEAAGAAPSHVTQRVASDYAARLDEVTRELGEHRDGVEQALAEAETRADGLTKQHTDRTDELAEARLRRQVGEFDEDQYEEIASRCKAALSELSKELGAVERDIDRYEEILTLIRGVRAKPAAAPAPPAPPPVTPLPATPAPVEAKGRLSEPGRPRVSQPQMDQDELAFLRSLTERGASPRPEVPSGQTPKVEPARAEPARPATISGERPVVPARPVTTSGERAIVAKKVEAPPAPPSPPSVPAPVAAQPGAAKAPERRSSEETKSLVCTECGTKNLPSEWYCEKCGAAWAPY